MTERVKTADPAVLVGNPTAQSGRAADWIRHARALLDEARLPHRFVPSEPDGATVDVVRRAIDDEGARLVIYMGGDGTFAEAAKGILASSRSHAVRLGMLPTGTANDQGKSFGLEAGPGGLGHNVEVIAAGVTVAVDVGRLTAWRGERVMHRDLFFDSFSVGFGASALVTRNRDRERVGRIPGLGRIYRDQLVYAGALVQRLLETYVVDVKFDLDVVVDGRVVHYESLLDVIVKNTRIFGGEWVFDPAAEADDGLFELIPITGRRDFTSKLVTAFRHNPLGPDDLRALGLEAADPVPGASFTLTVRADGEPPAAQVDGEEIPAGQRYQIDVLARALRLIVPREREL